MIKSKGRFRNDVVKLDFLPLIIFALLIGRGEEMLKEKAKVRCYSI